MLVALDVGGNVLVSSEGVPEDDKILLDCLEYVSYAKVSLYSIALVRFLFYYADVLFFQALHLTKSRIARKEANAQLRMELNAAHSKMAEVEHREQALTSVYEDLKKDFNDVRYSHAAVVKEKNEPEKTEREKERRFWNSS
jgi:hypothetical protein